MKHQESFIRYFGRTVTPVKVVPKKSSRLMKLVAHVLSLLTRLRIVDFPKRKFMHDYTTAIFSTIYSSHMSMDSDPDGLVVHELTHVLQWRERRVLFLLRYLFSSKWRAYYESEAVQSEMLLYDRSWTRGQADIWATRMMDYGCKPYRVAFEAIQARRDEIKTGKPKTLPLRVFRAVEQWKSESATDTPQRNT